MAEQAPSRSAVKIARGVVFLGRHPQPGAPLPEGAGELTERLLEACGLLKPWHLRVYDSPWFERLVELVSRHTIPGQMARLALRKRFMEAETRRAIGEGASQLLVVGAGFDTLALRLAREFPELLSVELDRKRTQRVKRRGVETLGLDRNNLRLVSADLPRTSLEEVLGATPGWRVDGPSVVVAEGVLMYLEEASVAQFLRSLRRVTAPASRVVFTYLGLDARGRLELGRNPWLLRRSLALSGEPLRWGIAPRALPGFLEVNGFQLDVATNGPPSEGIERFAVATSAT